MNNLFFGLSVMAVGMIVVFLGLVILIGCIWLLTRFTGQHRGKKPAPEKERTGLSRAADSDEAFVPVEQGDEIR